MCSKPKIKVPKLRIFAIFIICFCLCLTATAGFSGIFSYDESVAENHHPNGEDEMDMTAHLSTEDVSATNETTQLYNEIPGFASFFGNMLDSLLAASVKSEKQFKTLATGFPLIFPDLHKVLITL